MALAQTPFVPDELEYCKPSLSSLLLEPEVVNNLMNVVAIGLTLYVTHITRRLDRRNHDGGE